VSRGGAYRRLPPGVFLFAIVFGLSMDYEVFLISRIHEDWTAPQDAPSASSRRVDGRAWGGWDHGGRVDHGSAVSSRSPPETSGF